MRCYSDAKKMEELASKLSDSSELAPSSEGNEVQKLLGGIADRAKEEKFLYTKFFAIGLFRLLELTGRLRCFAASSCGPCCDNPPSRYRKSTEKKRKTAPSRLHAACAVASSYVAH